MQDSDSWMAAATWGRLKPSDRLVWCQAAGVDVLRCIEPFAALTMPEKVSLVVTLHNLEEFALNVAVPA